MPAWKGIYSWLRTSAPDRTVTQNLLKIIKKTSGNITLLRAKRCSSEGLNYTRSETFSPSFLSNHCSARHDSRQLIPYAIYSICDFFEDSNQSPQSRSTNSRHTLQSNKTHWHLHNRTNKTPAETDSRFTSWHLPSIEFITKGHCGKQGVGNILGSIFIPSSCTKRNGMNRIITFRKGKTNNCANKHQRHSRRQRESSVWRRKKN